MNRLLVCLAVLFGACSQSSLPTDADVTPTSIRSDRDRTMAPAGDAGAEAADASAEASPTMAPPAPKPTPKPTPPTPNPGLPPAPPVPPEGDPAFIAHYLEVDQESVRLQCGCFEPDGVEACVAQYAVSPGSVACYQYAWSLHGNDEMESVFSCQRDLTVQAIACSQGLECDPIEDCYQDYDAQLEACRDSSLADKYAAFTASIAECRDTP